MNKIIFYALVMLAYACKPDNKSYNTLYFNASFYPSDSTLASFDAMLVNRGIIVAIGNINEIQACYSINKRIDLGGAHVYPGWHDAHCHFWGYGMTLQQVDLMDAQSWDEVIERCVAFNSQHNPAVVIGRGWDQNLWGDGSFPENTLLNKYFPDKPVLLKRVDGHAAVVNDFLLNSAGINVNDKIQGGDFIIHNNKLTGVLIDNAIDIVQNILPPSDRRTHIKALLAAQDTCLSYGITTVTDAGLPTPIIMIIDSLQKVGLLKIRINAMVSVSEDEIDYWLKRGVYETSRLRVGSFKMYADGALGSRGACLLKQYHDDNHQGLILTQPEQMKKYVEILATSDFQLNTHCIGDSANRLLLKYYAQALLPNNDKRWRIEHAQVVNPEDLKYYKNFNIIPSVQPTHATSDMYWAPKRLGNSRIKHAYAYQTLLQQSGVLPLGTDFPVEQVNPLLTLYAAVTRRDAQWLPAEGFNKQEALTWWQAYYGMTKWPAYAAHMEQKLGNFAPGMYADMVLYSTPLMSSSPSEWLNIKPIATILN
jgi:predicted amidohydrolase YtcJ